MAIRLICILILFWGVSSVLRAPELSPAVALAEAGKAAAVADQEKKSSIIDQSAKKGLPTALSPELFTGEVKAGYIIAQTIPDVLAELHCYCGCDKSVGHGNLLDCFVDSHAAGWMHCLSEAQDAQALFESGAPPEIIKDFIDQKYGQ